MIIFVKLFLMFLLAGFRFKIMLMSSLSLLECMSACELQSDLFYNTGNIVRFIGVPAVVVYFGHGSLRNAIG